MSSSGRRRPDGSELVAALGLVFVIAGVVLWTQWLLPRTDAVHEAFYELVIHVAFGMAILLAGVHIERSELIPEERHSVMVWCFAGFALLFGLAIWSELGNLLRGRITLEFVSTVVVFGGMGGAFGAFVGVNRGRATRNRLLAEHNEAQRETLILLTRLLRHDIRNDITMITGHAEMLEEYVGSGGGRSLDVIQQRSEAVDRLLRDTDTLVDTLDADREFHEVDITNVLEDELDCIRDAYPEVTIEVDVPDDLSVVADGLVHQLFLNLFQNAVDHNDLDSLTLGVQANSETDDLVEIVVWDDGTGIDPAFREHCFELGEQGPESDGDGLGLYLVSRLVDVYGGEIELADSPDGGAQFTVRLPGTEQVEQRELLAAQ